MFVCRPGRNFATAWIMTDSDLCGLVDATLSGRETTVVANLEEHVAPCLAGRNPHDIEGIWQYPYKGAHWRAGAFTMAAIAAVDMALRKI